jgi:hypothetical protein
MLRQIAFQSGGARPVGGNSEASVPAEIIGKLTKGYGKNAIGAIGEGRVQGLRGCLIDGQERVCGFERELGPEWQRGSFKPGKSYEFTLTGHEGYQTLTYDVREGTVTLQSAIPTKGIPGVIYIQAPQKFNTIVQDRDGNVTAQNSHS